MKTLILLTSDFPYGTGEVFVENEFPFLAEKFERIFIITTSLNTETLRPVPPHATVIHIPYDASLKNKILTLLNFFNPDILRELHFIRNEKKIPLSRAVLSILLGCYAKGLEMNELLEKLVRQHQIPTKELYLYSYWMKDLTAGMAVFKQQHTEVRAFCRAHGWDTYFERHQPPYLPFRHFILQRLDACYCISSNGRNYLNALTNEQYASKIHLAPLGSFNTQARINPPGNNILRIASCSSVIPLKRLHLIIEALALISDVEIEWIHFGDGPLMKDISWLAEQKLADLSNIRLSLEGKISNVLLMKYYAENHFDLFLNVSETEGLPVSIMEALSFGIPVVATTVGGVAEIVTNEFNGFLLPSNPTPEQITETLRRYKSLSEEEKNRMRGNAFTSWNQRFNAQTNYTRFVQSILELKA